MDMINLQSNVYYQVNEDKMPKTVEIADEEFKFIEGGDITVHKGNNTYILEEDIDEILSGNILKEKNITTIKSIHDKLNQDQELYEFKVQTIDQFKSLVEEKDTANYSEQSIRLFANAISAFSSCTNNAFTKGEVDWIKEIFETLINETPTVDLNIENRVKQAYYDTYLSGVSSQTVDDVVIDKYLGTYNGSYVVKFNEITQSRTSYYNADKWDELSLTSLTYNNVKVWNNGVMYTIEQAYDMGLIVGENLYLIIRLD